MKTLIWGAAAVLALMWTVVVALMASIVDWLSTRSMDSSDWMGQVSQWPLPPWLAPWLDPATARWLQEVASGSLRWLSDMTPHLQSALQWISPLLWVGWGLGLIALLVVSGAAHFAVGKFRQ